MGLERLRPMLWWCNLTGILPFGMELQQGPNGPIFKRVTFSFKSPAIWWSIITSFVLVGNFSTLILSLLQHNPSPSKNVGINFKDLAARFHYIHYAVLTALSFFLVMKYKLMKEAVEDIHLVDINIARHIVKPSCKTTSMTIIAFLISSGWVNYLIITICKICWMPFKLKFLNLDNLWVPNFVKTSINGKHDGSNDGARSCFWFLSV